MSLSGRVALVTGASQGIGRACALKLAAVGRHRGSGRSQSGKIERTGAADQQRPVARLPLFRSMSPTKNRSRLRARRSSDNLARSTSWSTMPASPATSLSCV